MHVGRVVFVQLMEHLPWKSFGRIVSRYGGDPRVRGVSCANQFRCMALAQLTYRESLCDIEACLRAQQAKRYRLGIRGAVAGSTLAEANESRAIVKQRLEPSATLYETLQILRPTMFETTRLNQLLDFAAPATPRSHFQQPIESVRELTGQ